VFATTRLLDTDTVPVSVKCGPPPLPGSDPVELFDRVLRRTAVVPALASMAPPARVAVLLSNVLSSTVSVPPLLNAPPPEAPVPTSRCRRRSSR